MSLLGFLKSSTVEEAKAPAHTGGGIKKQWNPAPALVAVRIWKDGSVFPSTSARDKFDLEYRKAEISKTALPLKEGETEQRFKNDYKFPDGTGNGFDFIDSRLWNEVKGDGAMLLVAVTGKKEGKVDLFNTVAYDETGNPKETVMSQGSATFGKDVMLPAIEEVYGIKFNGKEPVEGGVDFVDLMICESIPAGEGETFDITGKFSKKIAYLPKKKTRGADKGAPDYERRDDVKIYGLIPAAMVLSDYDSKAAGESEAPASSAALSAETAEAKAE